jgi:uncharacterized protein Yka (UPF0111/DUF47 family)
MINLTATGRPFGEVASICPPQASSWIMDRYREHIHAEMGDQIRTVCSTAKQCNISIDELTALMMQALDGDLIPGLSKDDTRKLIQEVITKELENDTSV